MKTETIHSRQSRPGGGHKFIVPVGVLLALAVLTWFFPLFHVRSLAQQRSAAAHAEFNATDFADTFWHAKLLPAVDQAAVATNVLAAIAVSPQKAHDQFGRSVGISSSYYFFLQGEGRVVTVDKDGIGLSLNNAGTNVDVLVPLGLVFGNALRDATGLLDGNAFPNSQNFNDIAAGLNHIAETQVLPAWQHVAVVGQRVRFAGCVEVADEDEDLKPLKLVPIQVKILTADQVP